MFSIVRVLHGERLVVPWTKTMPGHRALVEYRLTIDQGEQYELPPLSTALRIREGVEFQEQPRLRAQRDRVPRLVAVA